MDPRDIGWLDHQLRLLEPIGNVLLAGADTRQITLPYIVCDQQRAGPVGDDPNRPSLRFCAVGRQESRQHVDGLGIADGRALSTAATDIDMPARATIGGLAEICDGWCEVACQVAGAMLGGQALLETATLAVLPGDLPSEDRATGRRGVPARGVRPA